MKSLTSIPAKVGVASATLAVVLAATLCSAPANASTPAASATESRQLVGTDGFTRSFTPDAINATGIGGVSSTVVLAPGDELVASHDGQSVQLVDAEGDVLFTVSTPRLGTGASGTDTVAAKLVVSGSHIVIAPANSGPSSFSACGSSFWGNIIFNVGMTGMCAALAVGTVVGGVVCTAALIGANTQINFDSQC